MSDGGEVNLFLLPQGGRTALIYAARGGYPAGLRLLVEAGAHLEAKDIVRGLFHFIFILFVILLYYVLKLLLVIMLVTLFFHRH